MPPASLASDPNGPSAAHLAAIRSDEPMPPAFSIWNRWELPCQEPGDQCFVAPIERYRWLQEHLARTGEAVVLHMWEPSTICPDGGTELCGTDAHKCVPHNVVAYEIGADFRVRLYDPNLPGPTSLDLIASVPTYQSGKYQYTLFCFVPVFEPWVDGEYQQLTHEAFTDHPFTTGGRLSVTIPDHVVPGLLTVQGIVGSAPSGCSAATDVVVYLSSDQQSSPPLSVTVAPGGTFSADITAQLGKNVLTLVAGTTSDTGEKGSTGATLTDVLYACPSGQTWNPDAQPPACECPSGQTWNPDPAPGKCECSKHADGTCDIATPDTGVCPAREALDPTGGKCWAVYSGTMTQCATDCTPCDFCSGGSLCGAPACVTQPTAFGVSDAGDVDIWPRGQMQSVSSQLSNGAFTLTVGLVTGLQTMTTVYSGTVDGETMSGTIAGNGTTILGDVLTETGTFTATRVDPNASP